MGIAYHSHTGERDSALRDIAVPNSPVFTFLKKCGNLGGDRLRLDKITVILSTYV